MEEIPTLDSYIGLKLSLERLEWKNKVIQRQKNIENLRQKNKRVSDVNEHFIGRRISAGTRKEMINLSMPPTIFGQKKFVVDPNDGIGTKISGERVKSAGSLKKKTKQGNLFHGPTFDLVYTVPSLEHPYRYKAPTQRHHDDDAL